MLVTSDNEFSQLLLPHFTVHYLHNSKKKARENHSVSISTFLMPALPSLPLPPYHIDPILRLCDQRLAEKRKKKKEKRKSQSM